MHAMALRLDSLPDPDPDPLAVAALEPVPLRIEVEQGGSWLTPVPPTARTARLEVRLTTRRRWRSADLRTADGWRALPVGPLVVGTRLVFDPPEMAGA